MKNNTKNTVSLILLSVILCLISGVFSGCSPDAQEYAWVLATASPEDTVTQIYAEKFVEEVSDLSEGRMKIQIYSNSSLGGDTELLESVMCGDIPFVIQNTAPQVSYLPRLCIFDLPMVFEDIDELHEVLDNEAFMDKINEIYEEKGICLLAMSDQDFRVMTSNKNVESLSDFSGVKIRTMENSYHMEFWRAIGASPTAMAFSEVYIGLQQNTIDAQENPYEVIVSNKFYEQQDYIIKTNHLPHLLSLITNGGFMEGLTEEERSVIYEAAEIACEYSRKQAQVRKEERIAECEEGGSEVVGISKQLRQEMLAASENLYKEIRIAAGDDELYDMYTGQAS